MLRAQRDATVRSHDPFSGGERPGEIQGYALQPVVFGSFSLVLPRLLYLLVICTFLYYANTFIRFNSNFLVLGVMCYLFKIFFNFYCYSITVVCLFSPSLHPTPTEPTSLPHLHPPPGFCPRVLCSSSCNPLSSLSPPHSLLTIVRLFFTSMSLVIFCLLFSSLILLSLIHISEPTRHQR